MAVVLLTGKCSSDSDKGAIDESGADDNGEDGNDDRSGDEGSVAGEVDEGLW